jgi:hypothetical protein
MIAPFSTTVQCGKIFTSINFKPTTIVKFLKDVACIFACTQIGQDLLKNKLNRKSNISYGSGKITLCFQTIITVHSKQPQIVLILTLAPISELGTTNRFLNKKFNFSTFN